MSSLLSPSPLSLPHFPPLPFRYTSSYSPPQEILSVSEDEKSDESQKRASRNLKRGIKKVFNKLKVAGGMLGKLKGAGMLGGAAGKAGAGGKEKLAGIFGKKKEEHKDEKDPSSSSSPSSLPSDHGSDHGEGSVDINIFHERIRLQAFDALRYAVALLRQLNEESLQVRRLV